jgi:HEAT repeat protein
LVIYIYIFACLREALICPFLFSYSPLIRILGDRFPWQVKSAILSTLTIIISKGGLALKPFLPQLQTTFVKCLQDNNRSVRTRAASALGKLSALSTRVDPLVSDLLSMLQVVLTSAHPLFSLF